MMTSQKIRPEIKKFIAALVAAGIIMSATEALIIAKNRNRYRPDYGFLAGVAATRAAHKMFGPTG